MKAIKIFALTIFASALAVSGCTRAQAAPLDVSVGYQNNEVVNQEGVVIKVGTEVNNIRLGLTTFTSNERLETYGGFIGVPLQVQGTKFSVVPQVYLEQYRKDSDLVGSIGIGGEYQLPKNYRLEAVALASRSLDNYNESGTNGVYSLALTKRF